MMETGRVHGLLTCIVNRPLALVTSCRNQLRATIHTRTAPSADLATGKTEVLAGGRDFYAAPRLSADGSRLAWITWDHPNMPWDDTDIWVADIGADGKLSGERKVR